jgi:Ran GTPase-activating protein (RanGAP) involved in mRNA processing and transport
LGTKTTRRHPTCGAKLGIVTEIGYKGITNVEMKKECLAALLAIFRNGSATNSNSSTDITFNNANLCGEGIVWLSKLVEVSSKLQYLFLYHNRIDDMDSARCLSRSLKSHTGINHLHLCHCDLGSSPEILSVILQSDVYRISLDNNNIDSLGAVKIAENLDSNPPIRRIDLEHNRLNDDDAILISQALKRNTNLKTICLYSNNFTSIGVKALLTCVFDSSSLNAISESNYTLQQLWLFWKSNNLFRVFIDCFTWIGQRKYCLLCNTRNLY